MKIVGMRKESRGAIRAFFNLEYGPFIIRDFKLMESDSGLWVSLPKKTYIVNGEKKWDPVIQLVDSQDKKTMDLLSALARDSYLGAT